MANRENAYNFASVLFHWLTALWVVSMLTVGIIFHELSFLHPWRYALETVHILFGVVGFFFLWFVWAADFGMGLNITRTIIWPSAF